MECNEDYLVFIIHLCRAVATELVLYLKEIMHIQAPEFWADKINILETTG